MNASVKKVVRYALAFVLAGVMGPLALRAQFAMTAANLPLWFESGHGQATPFAAHGPDSAFFMTETNAHFLLRKPSGGTAAASMEFIGANAVARIAGEAEMLGKVNYLVGKDPTQWRSGVPVFARVRVDNLYPGVGVVYYGNGRQLEYDFDLAAGVDPKTIAIRFDGAKKISVDPQGELIVSLDGGTIIQHRPVVYQNTGQNRREISGGYQMLDAHTATFALGDYDHGLPLVIDPVLSYSTYFSGNVSDAIHAIALGNDGSIYVAGETLSTVFTNVQTAFTNVVSGTNVLQSTYQTNFQGGSILGDAFVAKFGGLGTNIYFTYLGGSGDEAAFGLAVDNAGHAFVTGYTDSANFPTTTNAFQQKIAGLIDPVVHTYPVDAFVTELGANGTNLIYSTYLGGSQADVGTAIVVDTNENAYVVGYTGSKNFPSQPGAYQLSLQCTNTVYNLNAFLVEVASNGASLKYSSYFGGTNFDVATCVALGPTNCIYVAGYTDSTNFPNTNAVPGYTNLNGATVDLVNYDAFVARFNPGFKSLIYSTFLGGSNTDWATGIAVDNSGNAYVVGATASTNFPYTNYPPQLSSCVYTNTLNLAAATNAFLSVINWNGSKTSLGYSTIFGGAGYDLAIGVGLDQAGHVFVAGSASSTNFPVTMTNLTGSLSATNLSSPGFSDVFITAFSSLGTNFVPLYSAYLGGNSNDFGAGVAVDTNGNVYVAGTTTSSTFPTFNARQTALVGYSGGFLSKIVPTIISPSLSAVRSGTNVVVSWSPVNQETPDSLLLESTTNLLSANSWSVVTNSPVFTNGVYDFKLPYVNPTNSSQFFRLQLY